MPQNGVSGPPQLTFSRNVFPYPKSIFSPFFPIISATTAHKPLRVTRTGLMNKVTPSQPERDSIDQTPNEKETCSMAKEKK